MKDRTTTKTTTIVVGLLMAALILFPFIPTATAETSSDLQRSLPSLTVCGARITVTLHLDWGAARDDAALFIEETYPSGWTVASKSHGGSTSDPGAIKWFLTDPSVSQVTYDLALPSAAQGVYTFSGAYRDDTMAADDPDKVSGGSDTLSVSCPAATVARAGLPEATCGGSFTVRILIDWHETQKHALAIEETPPSGWALSNPSNGGNLGTSGAVKWFLNDTAVTEVTYEVEVSATAEGPFAFRGSYRDDSMDPDSPSAQVRGDASVDVACGSSVSRSGLEPNTCGGTLTVTLQLDWLGATSLFIEETYPAGWTATGATNGGSRSDAGKVKWFLTDTTVSTVGYTVAIPAGAAGTFTFAGLFRDDTMASEEASKTVLGQTAVSVSCGTNGDGTTDGPAQASRSAPMQMHPQSTTDQSVLVTIHIVWNNATAVTLREAVAGADVVVADISHGGTLSGTTITWQLDDPAVTSVSYRMHIPSTQGLSPYGSRDFAGTVMDDTGAASSDVTGASGIRVVHRFDNDGDCVFSDNALFTAISDWKSSLATDDELFSGIDAWKLSPDSYCTT